MENKLATHRWSVLHYLRPVTALEDYTSITRLNFKLSVYPLASNRQPFAGYSMVLQSVTRAVTRATARRRGCFFSKSGLRFSFCPPSFFFSFFFFHTSNRFSCDRYWSMAFSTWKRSFIKKKKFRWKLLYLEKFSTFRMIIEIKFEHYKFRDFVNKIQFCLLKFE